MRFGGVIATLHRLRGAVVDVSFYTESAGSEVYLWALAAGL